MKKLNMRMSQNELQDLEFLASVGRFPIVVQAEDNDGQNPDAQNVQEKIHGTNKNYTQPYLSMLDLAKENRGIIKGTYSAN